MDKSIFDCRVAVLYGGIGSEREVSRQSGKAVLEALLDSGCNAFGVEVTGKPEQIGGIECDLAFIALHGEFGEDGQVQQLLEDSGISYIGSGVEASRTIMNKSATKDKFVKLGLPTANWFDLKQGEFYRELLAENKFSLPCVVKPNSRGSSVGVHIVRNENELAPALESVFEIDEQAIVERYVSGRELTVGVLHGKALPVIELEVPDAFYDYNAKYEDDRTVYHCPAKINSDIAQLCSSIAEFACSSLGVRDMARVDFILGRKGLVLLEINTIPGFTSHSLLPKAAAAQGISFKQLCLELVEKALQREGVI